MAQAPSGFDHRAELVRVINQVRSRWRTKLLVRGAVAVVGGSVVALVLAAYGLDMFRFNATSVIGFRLALVAVFAALVVFTVVRPMRRRVTDMQVALYVEEHAPSVEAAILSAVEVTSGLDRSGRSESPALIEQLVKQAVAQCRSLDSGRVVGLAALRRHGVTLAGIAVATTLLLVFGPDVIRQGAGALLVVSRSAEAASPYAIDVKPGNANVPRGSDQTVTAKLLHFSANDVTLMVRPTGVGDFDRVPLTRTADQAAFEGLLFKLAKPVEYYVESDGVRSPTYKLELVDLPAVAKLDLEYHFPAYTGLPVQKVEGGGDVAALKGTDVRLHITPTMATGGGVLDMGDLAWSEEESEDMRIIRRRLFDKVEEVTALTAYAPMLARMMALEVYCAQSIPSQLHMMRDAFDRASVTFHNVGHFNDCVVGEDYATNPAPVEFERPRDEATVASAEALMASWSASMEVKA